MRIFLDSIGCRLNQSEIEKISAQFRLAGHQIVATPTEADLVVVNTCAVTVEAASDSRQKIRQAHRAGSGQIVVTGCWATFDPAGAGTLPGVTRVVPNSDKNSLVANSLGFSGASVSTGISARQALPGVHQRTRAFIKVQDGCDNHCTFCLTRLVRGQSISTGLDEILTDIQAAILGGVREIVLTGVQLGAWGKDLPSAKKLSDLVKIILKETTVDRLRLSSVEPWSLDPDFYSVFADHRVCRHLHLPLQSGSGATLKRMARQITPEAYARTVSDLRSAVPDIALTTDILVGFPGETDQEFQDTLAFIREMKFTGGHVFTYSPRPGTAAVKLPGVVPPKVRKERNAVVREVLADLSERYWRQQVNTVTEVLWETAREDMPGSWTCEGLTGTYIRVTAKTPKNLWNNISQVRLTSLTQGGMIGEVL
ncbi:MAG TPA: tRNA (N(6)-L-threonylcarbamoyladenosine(37)-C(2))-methylthiotransferase MtaB [Anaerolineaceae bacterium]